jgi:uncharacterized protein (TIGR02285 family)
MSRTVKRWSFLALCALIGLRAHSIQAETITWALQDFPPAYILVNEEPGDGINDAIIKLIVQRMKDTEHRYVVASTARIFLMLDSGSNLCFLGLRTPERARQYYLTDVQLVPPLQLIVRKQFVDKLPGNSNGQVSLPKVLANSDLLGVLVTQRSYGPRLDAIISKQPVTSNIQMISSSNTGGNFFDMLHLGRADYTIDFDFMLAYKQYQSPGAYEDLISVPIQENDTPSTAAVICPRTPWGLDAIVKIDAVLADLARHSGLGLANSRWYTPETVRRYGAAMKAFNLKRRSPSDPKVFQ